MQDGPAAPRPTPSPGGSGIPLPNGSGSFLEQALAAGPARPLEAEIAGDRYAATHLPPVGSLSVPDREPAAHSIEAALSDAPAVSPAYVPPAPPPPAARPVTASVQAAPVKPRPRTVSAPTPAGPRGHAAAVIDRQRAVLEITRAEKTRAELPAGEHRAGRAGDQIPELTEGPKKLRDHIWRWATIGISCAGGLASGWLGSSFSDQATGLLSRNKPELIAEASKDSIAGSLDKVRMVGKTDRATPVDDRLCTVLELDRGTGLTLAKPCKPVETAEYSSTLGKADLLAKPVQ